MPTAVIKLNYSVGMLSNGGVFGCKAGLPPACLKQHTHVTQARGDPADSQSNQSHMERIIISLKISGELTRLCRFMSLYFDKRTCAGSQKKSQMERDRERERDRLRESKREKENEREREREREAHFNWSDLLVLFLESSIKLLHTTLSPTGLMRPQSLVFARTKERAHSLIHSC